MEFRHCYFRPVNYYVDNYVTNLYNCYTCTSLRNSTDGIFLKSNKTGVMRNVYWQSVQITEDQCVHKEFFLQVKNKVGKFTNNIISKGRLCTTCTTWGKNIFKRAYMVNSFTPNHIGIEILRTKLCIDLDYGIISRDFCLRFMII